MIARSRTASFTVLITIILLILSCDSGMDTAYLKKQQIEITDISIFKNCWIHSHPRSNKDGHNIAYWYLLFNNGKDYVIPNYSVYTDISVIESRFDVLEYGKDIGIDSAIVHEYLKSKSDSIFNLYDSLDVYRIVNVERLGDFARFYLNDKDYLLFKPDSCVIREKVWEDNIKSMTKLDDNWYWHDHE